MGSIWLEISKLISLSVLASVLSLVTKVSSEEIFLFQFAFESSHNTIYSKFDSFACVFHGTISLMYNLEVSNLRNGELSCIQHKFIKNSYSNCLLG